MSHNLLVPLAQPLHYVYYFTNQNTGSGNLGKLTKEEEKKLKKSSQRISRALRLSKAKDNIAKLRGGGVYPITPKLITTKIAEMIVNAARDGSLHAISIIIACKISPKSEKFIKALFFGGNTDALVNEIAKNLQTKRISLISKMLMNKTIRKNINNILLELELIKEPLSQVDLLRLATYSITLFEIPLVKGAIITSRSLALVFITNKIKQVILSQLSREIARGILLTILSAIAGSEGKGVCGVDLTEIDRLKTGLLSRQEALRSSGAPEVSINPLIPTFNDEISGFVEIDPVVEKLTGSPLFNNPLIHYSPKFNVDYVMERLVIGNDISKLPRDHITNLW
jgi:hypothetical protein